MPPISTMAARFGAALIVCALWALAPVARSQPAPSVPASAPASAADLAKIQESLNAMRSFYEQRINALEKKVDTLQKQNTQLSRQVQAPAPVAPSARAEAPAPANAALAPVAAASREPAVSRNPPSSLGGGITLPKVGPVTPEISLILDGKYSAQSQNPDAPMQGFMPSGAGNIPRGFSLGESELGIAGTVDNLFRAEARFVVAQEGDGNFSIAAEEAFVETLGLPAGLKVKAGKFFSSVGYLNNKHPHEWDFVDLPLAYQAFFGGQLNDTGAQLSWVAPLDSMYLRFGGEIGQGTSYPNSFNYNDNKPRLGTLFAKLGGDLGDASSWAGGLSFVNATTGDRARVTPITGTDTFEFKGTTNVYVADFVYKWAPDGNASRQNFKLQAEAFWNTQNGSAVLNSAVPYGECPSPCTGQSFTNTQRGWYAQAIYQFMPNWRVGYRYDQLYSGTSSYGFAGDTLSGTVLEPWNPNRNTLMLDWANSEYSMLRLQLARDTSLGPGLVNNQVFLQYIVSLGAHGAHRY